MRVLQKEAKARMNFFDQIQEALENQQPLEGTPPQSTPHQTQKAMTSTSLEQLITLQLRTKTAKNTFVRNYPKTVMVQPPDQQTEDIYSSKEEILSVTDYMKVVQVGRIPKGHNHQHMQDLAQLLHANQTKVIVLTYEMRKQSEQQQEQHKSTLNKKNGVPIHLMS